MVYVVSSRTSLVRLTRGVKFVKNIGLLYGSGLRVDGDGVFAEVSDGFEATDNYVGAWGGTVLLYLGPHVVLRGDVVIRNNFGAGTTALGSVTSVVELHDGVRIENNIAREFLQDEAAIVSLAYSSLLFATGRVSIENNGVSGMAKKSGVIGFTDSSAFLSNGVSISHNTVAGLVDISSHTLSCANIVHLHSISISHNIAYIGDGGGARLYGRTVDLTDVLFRNNTAAGRGGGLMFDTLTRMTLRACSFLENTAVGDGGALAGAGDGAIVNVMSSNFERNRALSEGGCLYLGGSSEMTLNHTKVGECIAHSHGGGTSTRDDSSITLMDAVVIERCESLRGIGGGLQVGGLGLDVLVVRNTPVVVRNNRARRGGGISFMGDLNVRGASMTIISGNVATENGGGLYGFSNSARLRVDPDHSLAKILKSTLIVSVCREFTRELTLKICASSSRTT